VRYLGRLGRIKRMKEEKQAEKRTMTITSLVIESSVAMTGKIRIR